MSSVTSNLLGEGETGKSQVYEEVSQINQEILIVQRDLLKKYLVQLRKIQAEIDSIDIIDAIDHETIKEKYERYEKAKDQTMVKITKIQSDIAGNETTKTTTRTTIVKNNDTQDNIPTILLCILIYSVISK